MASRIQRKSAGILLSSLSGVLCAKRYMAEGGLGSNDKMIRHPGCCKELPGNLLVCERLAKAEDFAPRLRSDCDLALGSCASIHHIPIQSIV